MNQVGIEYKDVTTEIHDWNVDKFLCITCEQTSNCPNAFSLAKFTSFLDALRIANKNAIGLNIRTRKWIQK